MAQRNLFHRIASTLSRALLDLAMTTTFDLFLIEKI
jgi:hypothetical protein